MNNLNDILLDKYLLIIEVFQELDSSSKTKQS